MNPVDVEKVIGEFTDIPVLLTSEPDEKWGEKIILKIETAKSIGLEEEMTRYLKERLNPWEMPKEIKFVEKLERTKNGKIKR